MQTPDLHQRLESLGKKIDVAEQKLKDRMKWSHKEVRTGDELKARYRFLKSQLNSELNELERKGHHVSKLEAAVREWFDFLNLKSMK